jgi:hypothetical protein
MQYPSTGAGRQACIKERASSRSWTQQQHTHLQVDFLQQHALVLADVSQGGTHLRGF